MLDMLPMQSQEHIYLNRIPKLVSNNGQRYKYLRLDIYLVYCYLQLLRA